jgi:hypothetical protein
MKAGPSTRWALLVALVVVAGTGLLGTPRTVTAEEGGLQYYVPAVYGNLGLAKLPPKGGYLVNFPLYMSLDAPVIPKVGQIHFDISVDVVGNAFVPLYISDKKILGGDYMVGAAFVLIDLGLDSQVVGPDMDLVSITASKFGWGDVTAVPFGLVWRGDLWSFMFYEGINVPVGYYDINNAASLGINHWAFDTNLGFTRYDENFPIQLDGNFGFTVNTTNHATDYKSGSSVHFDYTVGYNFSERFQVGFSGYFFQQITGDSGSGATLGDFKGEGIGIGASVSAVIDPKHVFAVQFEWMHDVHTVNRFGGDYFVGTVIVRLWE